MVGTLGKGDVRVSVWESSSILLCIRSGLDSRSLSLIAGALAGSEKRSTASSIHNVFIKIQLLIQELRHFDVALGLIFDIESGVNLVGQMFAFVEKDGPTLLSAAVQRLRSCASCWESNLTSSRWRSQREPKAKACSIFSMLGNSRLNRSRMGVLMQRAL